MSYDWVHDICEMHKHYDVYDKLSRLSNDDLKKFFEFRLSFLEEEMAELRTAETSEDVVDALIDLCVVAIGTLDLFQVNPYVAWNEVLEANMNKRVGVKESRPNPFGLPDLIKPEGWQAPDHTGNHGLFTVVKDED